MQTATEMDIEEQEFAAALGRASSLANLKDWSCPFDETEQPLADAWYKGWDGMAGKNPAVCCMLDNMKRDDWAAEQNRLASTFLLYGYPEEWDAFQLGAV